MKSSLGPSWVALQKVMFTFLSPCTISELLWVYQNATHPEGSPQDILPEPKLCLLKTISFKDAYPVGFFLCCQDPRSMAWMVILWGIPHRTLGIMAMARKPISKPCILGGIPHPLTEIWSVFVQTRPSRGLDRICESQSAFQFPLGFNVTERLQICLPKLTHNI